MQMIWKKNNRPRSRRPRPANLPFEFESETDYEFQSSAASSRFQKHDDHELSDQNLALSKQFQLEGNNLAEEGEYREALAKWEAALALTPESAVLHEQKAQVLLEIGETWKALQAATRATELQPSWPEAWVTLSRAQLNFGEPELAVQSSKKALELQPNCKDAQADMEVAMHLIANKRQLTQVGEYRYTVGDSECSPADSDDYLTAISSKSIENHSPNTTNEECLNILEETSAFPSEKVSLSDESKMGEGDTQGKHSCQKETH